MEKVFAYLRVSDRTQVEGRDGKHKDGFTRQEKAIRDYCMAHDLKLTQIFQEDHTGTEEQRPVLAKLIVSLEQNGHGIKTVVIEKLDRLARDLMVQEAIVRDFKKQSFNIISVAEGPDLCGDDPTRKFIRQVMGAVAEYDKTMLVAKLRASRDRMRLKGKCEGRKSYRETEQGRVIINYIQSLRRKPKYGKRLTYEKIADKLNEEGYKTMDGKQWYTERVYLTLNEKNYRKPKQS